jgi:putative ABC transport system permease protein
MRFRERMLHGLDEDIRDHLDRETQDNIARGMSPEKARRAALLKFGNVTRVKEDTREVWTTVWLEQLLQDVRYAVRILRKTPVFAGIAILTLALGIGSTSAVFSVVDRVLFRSLPYPQSEQLVSFGFATPFSANEFLDAIDFGDWKRDSTAFAEVTSVHPGGRDCELSEPNPVRLECQQVDSDFLPTLGIQPMIGRNFTREENEPNAAPVALLSFGLWRSRYGGDPRVVGRSISLNGKSTQIVGVLPASFEMPTLARADLLIPLQLELSSLRRDQPQPLLLAFARLKPALTIPQARASLEPLFEQSLKFVPPQFRREVTLRVRSLRDRQVHDAKAASWVLLASVIALLLLATTNVANLLLARAAACRRETAVRAALGATPARLVRQALTESVLLSLLGGLLGCWLAYGLLRTFIAIAPDGIPLLQKARIDLRVLLFTLGISLACGLLFGSTPAWQSPQPEMLSGKDAQTIKQGFLRQLLVTSQIAISLVLLTGASLLLRSLWNLQAVPLGMDVRNVVTADVALARYRYPQAALQQAFFEDLEARLRRIPGVSAFALNDFLPPTGRENAVAYSSLEIAGRSRPAEGTGNMIGYRAVTSGYFAALGIPILQGRAFGDQDLLAGQTSVILSRALARKLFADEDPVGQRIRFDASDPWHTVVGVAADVKNNGLEAQADPEFYITWNDRFRGAFDEAHVIIRTPVDPSTMTKWLRGEVASLDPKQPITVETMTQRVSKLEDGPRFDAILLSFFALTGVALAAIGIYGVVGFLVAQRTSEIGVRMALGATPNAILKLMLRDVVRWTAWGVLLGFAGCWFATRFLRSLLFQVPPHDSGVVAVVLAIIVFVTFLAGWMPASKAMRVDPMVALRHE